MYLAKKKKNYMYTIRRKKNRLKIKWAKNHMLSRLKNVYYI